MNPHQGRHERWRDLPLTWYEYPWLAAVLENRVATCQYAGLFFLDARKSSEVHPHQGRCRDLLQTWRRL